MIHRYASELASYHKSSFDSEDRRSLLDDIKLEEGWIDSIDASRPVFSKVKDFVDQELGVKTAPETACQLRQAILLDSSSGIGSLPSAESNRTRPTKESGAERFLEAEIIAIYW